jgi:alpha-mannosidase
VTTTERIPLYYTFGNHMHWVDMEWLWGYKVLPDSMRDMLAFCEATGAKGNINFDGIGYEKMAVEAPEALQELRQAIARGQVEVVGGSYAQPYGLFHGSESNVRQRVYGVRTSLKHLGVRPQTFWEEEFDFFPQLPQLLTGVGMQYASLYFQWTWHTPEVPREETLAIWWEGIDGSRLLTASRNAFNLHQWPEDFAILLESDELKNAPFAGIVQWLELMPSPDWMCRSELMLPPLQRLIDNPRFDLRFVTLSNYLEAARDQAVTRRYTLADVFHGMSLGKNGDLFRRLSRRAESNALTAESLSSLSGLFGRPYPHWDVYPTWELEEAWRELLQGQHHDNDECEGLCGHVGKFSYERSLSLTDEVITRSLRTLVNRVSGAPGRMLVYNPLGWSRDAVVQSQNGPTLVRDVPAFGYTVIDVTTPVQAPAAVTVQETPTALTLVRGSLRVTVDRKTGTITQITSADFPNGVLVDGQPLGAVTMTRNGESETFARVAVSIVEGPAIEIRRYTANGTQIELRVSLAPELDAVDIRYSADDLPRPDGGIAAGLSTALSFAVPDAELIHDHPYAVSTIEPTGTYLRKYPTSEWMTSPQWFEEVHKPFTALQLLDFTTDEHGVLLLHDGSQAFLKTDSGVTNILSMYDPWDEDYFVSTLDAHFRLVPHGPLTHAERWKLAQEFTRPVETATSQKPGGDLPATFGPVWCDAPGVAVSAFYRETEEAGQYLETYAGAGLGFPTVLRLVELNGEATTAQIRLPGPVAAASETNLMGEIVQRLDVTSAEAPLSVLPEWSAIQVELQPHQIKTVYLDLVYGRKVPRNLDEHRSVWATVHRVEQLQDEA